MSVPAPPPTRARSRPAVHHSTRAAPALRALVELDPAIAALSLWCDHRDGAETGTQGSTISYGPDFSDRPLHERTGLAAHHILHVALRHPARMTDMRARLGGAFRPALWALAADAVVNEALLLADHALPRPAVTLTGLLRASLGRDATPEGALRDWTVDRLYFALTAGATGDGRAEGEGNGGGSGDGEGDGGTDGGSGSVRKATDYARAHGFAPDITPAAGESTTGADRPGDAADTARWRQHLARAMGAGQAAGRGLGRIGHLIADVPERRTPWEVVLRGALLRALLPLPQPAAHRPARRWLAGAAQAAQAGAPVPGFEPGRRLATDAPRVAVAIDASGSIDDARLALFWAEVTGIARRLRAELHVLVFDEAVRSVVRIDPAGGTPRLPPLPRGGGTAFAPVVAAATEMRASALVILTDMDGDPGPAPRGLSVIWAVPDARDATPPFGRLIDLSD